MNSMIRNVLRTSVYLKNNSFTLRQSNNIILKSSTSTINNNNSNGVFGELITKRYYHERVLDHYNNPRNIGSFDKKAIDVGTATVGAPACGDVMKIQIKVKDNIVVDVCFKTFGCGSAIASSSLATEWVKGKTLDECLEIKNTDIAKHLSLPPVKMHCSMLAEQAIKRAIYDYKVKHEKLNNSETTTIETIASL
ncbi:hypothetical protein RB653_001683 [Dictyostelium firmibasis]|uniref:Iron-sulfur cluster assembly protein n=1 Tax=Dictyostelium firmibasis TaxID=79012 RepID=A0AAN7YWU4_9MYCE